jgi:antitoxin CcdA
VPALSRRPTNLSLDANLLAEARDLKINLSRAAEAGISRAISEERSKAWREENADTIRTTNEYIEKYGLPLEKYRLF